MTIDLSQIADVNVVLVASVVLLEDGSYLLFRFV